MMKSATALETPMPTQCPMRILRSSSGACSARVHAWRRTLLDSSTSSAGLPEEEVGADGRAEDGDDDGHIGGGGD